MIDFILNHPEPTVFAVGIVFGFVGGTISELWDKRR